MGEQLYYRIQVSYNLFSQAQKDISMQHPNITFIGAGNMAHSLISGLIANGYPAQNIWATDPSAEKLMTLQKEFGINIADNNATAAKHAHILLLAIKPQIMHHVCEELAPAITHSPLIISIAAMIPIKLLEKWLGKHAIVRCMPNLPAIIRCAATALFANPQTNEAQKNVAESILRAVGTITWLKQEELMDAVTVLSGNGPAYFFLLIEMLQQSGEALGLEKETARLLSLETALGAARLALESKEDVAVLRQQVTSPGGTTERALEVLEHGNIRQLFFSALEESQIRAKTIANTFAGASDE